jgi:ABC-type Fe3+/spermidine/putrescine transport system ATPase subunit
VADFLSEANVANGQVEAFANGVATLTLGDARFDIATDSATLGDAKIALRPDVFEVTTDATVSPALEATVQKSAFIGKGVELVVSTKAGDLFVFLPKEKKAHPVGTVIRLAFPADEARLIV